MKGLLLALVIGVFFSGCGGKNGLAVNTLGGNSVDRYFIEGKIVSQKKCVIDEGELAILGGAGIGAAGAYAASGQQEMALIGAVVGGVVGLVVGNEIIAYETTIQGGDKTHKGYLKDKLPRGTSVEFTVEDGKLKNVNLLKTNS